MTDRQLSYLAAINQLTACNRCTTHREIAELLDICVGATHGMLKRLEDCGMVTMEPNLSRTIRLTEKGREMVCGTPPKAIVSECGYLMRLVWH